MKTRLLVPLGLALAFGGGTTLAAPVVGQAAPACGAVGTGGKPVALGDVKTATNHVNDALAALLAGRAVAQAVTRPYGCSIKYADG